MEESFLNKIKKTYKNVMSNPRYKEPIDFIGHSLENEREDSIIQAINDERDF